MGLFSRWTNKEVSTKEAPVEASNVEAQEEKSAVETGRERVAKMQDSIREAWKNSRSNMREGGKWILNKVIELGLGALGGAEKGAKKAGAKIEAGQTAIKGYASETRQEAGELAASFGDWAQEAANELHQEMNIDIDELNNWAQKNVNRYNEIKAAATADFERGVMQVNSWADERVKEYNQFNTNVKNAPGDVKKAWEELKAEVAAGISERFSLLREGAKKDYARAREAVGKRVDTFRAWFNQKRMEIVGTAQLKGEVAKLRELVERQNRLIEQFTALQKVKPEAGVGEEEDEGIVEYTHREAGA